MAYLPESETEDPRWQDPAKVKGIDQADPRSMQQTVAGGQQTVAGGSPFGGFNGGNVFDSWDLNPLSQQSGVARDDLANQRDAFLSPYMSQYRQGAASGGYLADQGDQNLFGDSGFQNFVRTGQTPSANAPPAQQWNAAPQGGPPGSSSALYAQLMQRAQQGTHIDANDPTLRAQIDPAVAQMTRSSRSYLDNLAEKGGGLANLQGEQRLASERVGQGASALEGQVLGREVSARRDEIAQALQMWGNQLSGDQRLSLERELGYLQDRSHTADRSQSMDQFLRELALREQGQYNDQDYQWAQLGG